MGVGASAGGLEAFIELLRDLPADTGMAFVLMQHLDPDHASALTQILKRATTMSLSEVTDNLPVEPNHAYVIPPNSGMFISQRVLKLQPRAATGPYRAIDAFFESLAHDLSERAIGVILSELWADYTGRPLEELQGQGWLEVMHPEDRPRAFRGWLRSQAPAEVFSVEWRLRNAQGQYRWFEMRGVPMFDDRGQLIRWLGTCTDIYDRRRGRAELERKVAECTAALQETVHDLEAFSYSISHDLRAPLRAMNNFAQILNDSYARQLDDRAQDYLKRISSAAERLDMLIQVVLIYTRIPITPASAEPVDLDKLCRDNLETYPNFQPPRTEIRIKGALPWVLGHRGFLTQCFANLLQNAVKFVPPGATPRVENWSDIVPPESPGSGEAMARISVRDHGIGIAPENQDRIFRMFEQIHPETEYEGTGIGLTIVREVAERMGGRVGFDNKLGEGSTFWLELRLAAEREGRPKEDPTDEAGNPEKGPFAR